MGYKINNALLDLSAIPSNMGGDSSARRHLLRRELKKVMKNYICPKCQGTDYFLGIRTISGVTVTRWNGFKTKQMPVCKVCDEIMVTQHQNSNLVNKIGRIGLFTILGLITSLILINMVISLLS
jgi:hypothetical protein